MVPCCPGTNVQWAVRGQNRPVDSCLPIGYHALLRDGGVSQNLDGPHTVLTPKHHVSLCCEKCRQGMFLRVYKNATHTCGILLPQQDPGQWLAGRRKPETFQLGLHLCLVKGSGLALRAVQVEHTVIDLDCTLGRQQKRQDLLGGPGDGGGGGGGSGSSRGGRNGGHG